MKRTWKILKGFLLIWGAITFTAFLVIGGMTLYLHEGAPTDRPTHMPASKHDVRFVLNRSNLGHEQIEEVVHSYASSLSFTGDHLDAHAIRLSQLDVSKLVYDEGRGIGGWYSGDTLDGPAKPALDFVAFCLASSEVPWFPTISEIRSSKMLVYVWGIDIEATRPIAAQVIFARPSDKMVFYFDATSGRHQIQGSVKNHE